MPRMADIQRNHAIREFFKDKYAGRVSDLSEARDAIQQRFHIGDKQWYRLRPQLQDMNDTFRARKGNGELVKAGPEPTQEEQPEIVLEVPGDLPQEARQVVNVLLAENHKLVNEMAIKDIELASTRTQIASMQARIRTLKEISDRLLNSL